jgi:hypothetical protein
LNPFNWPSLGSSGWGRSELAANFYDEILFNGATFNDLKRDGPRILVGATDLADGTRLIFNPENFDVLCTDLSGIRLARAAAASSAVPVVLSSITIDNHGGTCGYQLPPWARIFLDNPDPPRPASRTVKRLEELQVFADSKDHRYIHLVDGGVSDNVGMRGVLDVLSTFEALHAAGQKTPYDHVRNIYILVVNSLATPPNDWGLHENPPALLDVLIKATGTPIDRYSYDTVETLRTFRRGGRRCARSATPSSPIRSSPGSSRPSCGLRRSTSASSKCRSARSRQGGARLSQHAADVVRARRAAVDRLRLAAKDAILASPEIQRLIDSGRCGWSVPARGWPPKARRHSLPGSSRRATSAATLFQRRVQRRHLRLRQLEGAGDVGRLRPRGIVPRRARELATRRVPRDHVEVDVRVHHHQREIVDLLVWNAVETVRSRSAMTVRAPHTPSRDRAQRRRIFLAGKDQAAERGLRWSAAAPPSLRTRAAASRDSRTCRWWRSCADSSALPPLELPPEAAQSFGKSR